MTSHSLQCKCVCKISSRSQGVTEDGATNHGLFYNKETITHLVRYSDANGHEIMMIEKVDHMVEEEAEMHPTLNS